MWQIGSYLTIDIGILRPHYKKSITDSHITRPLSLHTPGFHFPANNCPSDRKKIRKWRFRGRNGGVYGIRKRRRSSNVGLGRIPALAYPYPVRSCPLPESRSKRRANRGREHVSRWWCRTGCSGNPFQNSTFSDSLKKSRNCQ